MGGPSGKGDGDDGDGDHDSDGGDGDNDGDGDHNGDNDDNQVLIKNDHIKKETSYQSILDRHHKADQGWLIICFSRAE